jgi:hypothetical protein
VSREWRLSSPSSRATYRRSSVPWLHVDLEEEGDQQPEQRGGDRAWRDPHPVLIRIRSEVINEPDPSRDENEHGSTDCPSYYRAM